MVRGRLTVVVSITLETSARADLPLIANHLSAWQTDPWAGHLHPGDLGWHSSVGSELMAADLRFWTRDGSPVAVGMLDGSEVLRMAVDPSAADDEHVAARIFRDLTDLQSGLFLSGEAVVEARGARALRALLRANGWADDEPWTPLTLDLSGELDVQRLERANLRVERVGPDAADDWTSIHWSAFRGTPFDEHARERFVTRWVTLMRGPFSDRAHSLIGYDSEGVPVAVTTVWTAGHGRPGLIEPMGVHREHHGRGYGVAISLAGALALRDAGASSAAVVAENSNPAALATYLSTGFLSLGEVTDLRRT